MCILIDNLSLSGAMMIATKLKEFTKNETLMQMPSLRMSENTIEVRTLKELKAIAQKTDFAFIVVGPELASALVNEEVNNKNRNASKSVIANYVEQIKNNEWVQGASTIMMDTNFNLADGQHRLFAIIQSGQSQIFMFRFNVSYETKLVVDTGKNRSVTNSLQMEKFSHSSYIGGATRKFNHYLKNSGNMNNIATKLTTQSAIKLINENPKLKEITDYIRKNKTDCKDYGNPTDLIASYQILSKSHAIGSDVFFQGLIEEKNTINNVDYHEFFKSLRSHLRANHERKQVNPHLRETITFYIMFSAWNHFIQGKTTALKLKKFNASSAFPVIEVYEN